MPNRISTGRAVAALIPLLRWYPWTTAGIVLLGILASLVEGIGISLFIPLLQTLDVERTVSSGNWLVDSLFRLFEQIPADRRLYVIAALIFGSVLVKTTLQFSNGLLYGWLDTRIGHRLRSGVFAQMMALSYRSLERTESGRLLNVLASETWRTSQAIGVLVRVIIILASFAVYAALLMLLSWKLTLLIAVAMLFISGLIQYLTRKVGQLGAEATKANSVLAKRILQTFAGMKVIRTYGREAFEQNRFDQVSRRVSQVFWRMNVASGTIHPVYEVLTAGLLAVILILTAQSSQSLPVLLVFVFILYRLQPKIKSLDTARVELAKLATGTREVTAFLEREGKEYTSSGTEPFRSLVTGIQFKQVTYRYEGSDRPALDRVTLDIAAGKTTAIVGPSGAGKSTLINLVLRLYEPTEGEITVDGRSLSALDLSSWRNHAALVSQDVFIFDATIRENIAYGRLDATEAEVIEAARQADAHDFIMQLPDGYESELGDRGLRLSGGQMQRLSLARAIVRNPEILILDEATNSLDSLSEHFIHNALVTFGKGRTVLIIAHRFSTIEQADQVVVFQDGQVCEQGRPEELLRKDGLFARLHALQFGTTLARS